MAQFRPITWAPNPIGKSRRKWFDGLDPQRHAAESGGMPDQPEKPHARDERYVWFVLVGDFDPDEITRVTGLTPSEIRRIGDKPRPGAAALKNSSWSIESGLAPSDEFHEHVDDLLGRLRPGWSALRALGGAHEAHVEAAIYCRQAQGPLLQVSPAHGAAIAELGATLGFDIYALPEDEPDDDAAMQPLTRDELSNLSGRLAPKA